MDIRQDKVSLSKCVLFLLDQKWHQFWWECWGAAANLALHFGGHRHRWCLRDFWGLRCHGSIAGLSGADGESHPTRGRLHYPDEGHVPGGLFAGGNLCLSFGAVLLLLCLHFCLLVRWIWWFLMISEMILSSFRLTDSLPWYAWHGGMTWHRMDADTWNL